MKGLAFQMYELNSLFVEGAAPARGAAVLAQALGQLLVQGVRQEVRDPLPGQDQDHDHGRLAVVPRTLTDQAQQLLLVAASSDHLQQPLALFFAKHSHHLTELLFSGTSKAWKGKKCCPESAHCKQDWDSMAHSSLV